MTKQYQLPKEFAERWVAALRSGEYKQTQELLGRKADNYCAYCCLGVAAKLQGFDDLKLTTCGELAELTSDTGWDEETLDDLLEMGIPMSLMRGDLKNKLINLNDKEGYTFPQIADWLEKNVEFTESEAQNV